MKGKSSKQLIPVLLVLLLLPVIAQTAQTVHGQNTTTSNQWALSLSIENAQNVSSSTFAPFNQIQLFSTVTYGNASVPDLLVTFKVQGPTDSANPTNITAIGKTDAAGIANASFRLPAEAQGTSSVTGTWQATATIQTSNSTLQKSLSFTTQWNLKIASISTQNQQGQNQTIFFPGNTVTVGLTISDAGQPQQANITLNMQDASGETVNQTQIENTQINNNSTSPTQMQASIEIPRDAIAGEASITAAIYSGTYQNVDIPAGENQTTYFSIASSTAPATTPKPSPAITENSVSLFIWLLIAAGLFTFTVLFAFLKRKPAPKVKTQMPSIPPTIPGPTVTTPAAPASPASQVAQVAPATMSQSTAVPNPTLAPEITEQKPVEPTFNPAAIQTQGAPKSQIFTELNKISSAANRIQALEAEIKSEKEQLSKDLFELHQKVDDEQKAMMSYFEVMKAEIARVGSSLTDKDHKQPEENNKAPKQKNKRSQPERNENEEEEKPD